MVCLGAICSSHSGGPLLPSLLTGRSHFKHRHSPPRRSSIHLQLRCQTSPASYKPNRSLLPFHPQRSWLPGLSQASGSHLCLQHPCLPIVGQEERAGWSTPLLPWAWIAPHTHTIPAGAQGKVRVRGWEAGLGNSDTRAWTKQAAAPPSRRLSIPPPSLPALQTSFRSPLTTRPPAPAPSAYTLTCPLSHSVPLCLWVASLFFLSLWAVVRLYSQGRPASLTAPCLHPHPPHAPLHRAFHPQEPNLCSVPALSWGRRLKNLGVPSQTETDTSVALGPALPSSPGPTLFWCTKSRPLTPPVASPKSNQHSQQRESKNQ